MADDTSTATTTETDAERAAESDASTDATTESGTRTTERVEAPPEVKRALNKANKEAEALRLKIKEYEDRDKTDQQKLEERATAAEKVAADASGELNRLRAALDAGLDAGDADLVTGSTEAEMKASATRLAERFGAGRTSFDGGPRTPAARPVDMNDLIRRQRSTR